MIVSERKGALSKSHRFGEAMQDGRLTNPSSGKVYCLRKAILLSKQLGRILTDEEMKQFEIECNE